MTVRERVRGLVVKWRRWRLLRAYMRVAHQRRVGDGRSSVRGGFVNHLIALESMERDGLIEIHDIDGARVYEWRWPDQ
ncbi:hypothetical protein C478_07427 [Natrinema thermotolerans DSM 11552]|nr:hypothetical protein C478_07427 [Natrinema thermotolerans DSM 11552]